MSSDNSSNDSRELEIVADVIGYVAGTCAAIITIPQIYKVIKTRSANDIAVWSILLLIVTSILFTVYGVLIDSIPLIVTEIFAFTLDTILLVLKIYYDRRGQKTTSMDAEPQNNTNV